MMQTAITLVLVAIAAAYASWRLMPAPWRRALQQRGVRMGLLQARPPQSTGKGQGKTGCGSCNGCKGCG